MTIDKLMKNNSKSIELISKCITKYIEESQKKVLGFYTQLRKTEEQIGSVLKKDEIDVNLEWLDLDKIELDKLQYDYDNTLRFVPIYLSKQYEGSLKLSSDEEFITQILEKLKSIDVDIEKTQVKISPSYDNKPTLLFRMRHNLMKNVYFAIIKYSPKGYRFYFLYDIFSEVCEFNKEKVIGEIDALNSELVRYSSYYSRQNVINAVLLHAFQQEIMQKKKEHESIESAFETLFGNLDQIRAQITGNKYPNSTMINVCDNAIKVSNSICESLSIDKSIIKSIEKLKIYAEDYIYIKGKTNTSIDQINIEIDSLKIDAEEEIINNKNITEEKVKNLREEINDLERIKNRSLYDYKHLSRFQHEIPLIVKIGNTEERIKNLEKLIDMSKNASILEKIKSYFSTYSQELDIERDSLNKMKKNIRIELEKLIEKRKGKIESLKTEEIEKEKRIRASTMNKIQKLESMKSKNINDREADTERDARKFSEFKQEILRQIDAFYKKHDREWKEKTTAMKDEESELMKEYKDFFHQLQDQNYMELFKSIEKLYMSEFCSHDLLPHELQMYLSSLKTHEKSLIDKLDINTHYNNNLKIKLTKIKKDINSLIREGGIQRGIIEAIEETIVNDLALIY